METGFELMAAGAVPALGSAFPTGVVTWEDAAALAVWFVFVALIGTLLGILRERTTPHVHPSEDVHSDHPADGHLPHAA